MRYRRSSFLMPILLPVALSFGMDPLHFGILVAANVGIGMVSPPVGMCLYVACGLAETPYRKGGAQIDSHICWFC